MDKPDAVHEATLRNESMALCRVIAIVISVLVLSGSRLAAQEAVAPGQSNFEVTEPVLLDMARLEANRTRLRSGDTALQAPLRSLLARADRLLAYRPVSVMQKRELPPSGDRHDYMSVAPYWWPDTSKPGGVPYIRRDGDVNPESRLCPDKENMPTMCAHAWTLALAYHYSGRQAYARHAATLIRTWFLDTATRMNPHLRYGQAVKGIVDGRAEGIIETRHLIYALDAVSLLRASGVWSDIDHRGLQSWFRQYLRWMETDPIGLDERSAKNNHGVRC